MVEGKADWKVGNVTGWLKLIDYDISEQRGCQSSGRRVAGTHAESVVGIHERNRHRQVGQFLLAKGSRSRYVGSIRDFSLGHVGDRFSPREGGAFACIKLRTRLLPYARQY